MALGGSDVLKLIIDADSSGATREFDKLGKSIKSSVGDAEKATTGFKGALSGAFDGLQSKSSAVSGIFQKIGISSEQAAGAIATALPAAGLAAGAALVAFAAKGVQAFQETALAAGKFSDATGLSVESASRYIAIADDIGVGASTIQNAFVKMEKAMAGNRAAFSEFIATGKNGAVDLDATFLNVVTHLQGIRDPIERANESSKLFGKGFAEVAQILGTDADTLKAKLASVSKQQVITESELQKARAYQAAMDNLKDSTHDLSMSLGQELVGSLATAANGLASFVNLINKLPDAASKSILGGGLGNIGAAFTEIFSAGVTGAAQVKGALDGIDTSKLKAGVVDAGGFGDALGRASVTASDFGRSADALAENLGHETQAFQDNKKAIDDVHNALLDINNTQLDTASLQQRVIEAMKTATEVHKDKNKTSLEGTVADNDAAKAALQLAENQKEIGKASGDADGGQKRFIDTLKFISGSASPGVKAAIDAVIGSYETFGQQNPEAKAKGDNTDAIAKIQAAQRAADVYGRTTATAAIHADDQASGKISVVKGGVDSLRGGVTVNVGANTTAARSAINGLINGLNSISSITGKHFSTIAKGSKNFAGGLALVGERGPELAFIPKGTQVKTAAETKAIMDGPTLSPLSDGSGGTVVNINVSGAVDPYSTARQIQTILAKGGYAGFSAKAA